MPLLRTRWCTYNVYLDVPQLTQTHIKPIRENGTIPTKIKKKTLCGGMNAEGLVELTVVETATSSMRTKRSTN